jgi:hypothetical protein
LPADFKRSIRAEQIEWIETLRDKEARVLLNKGYSKAIAYAYVTDARSDYLLKRLSDFSNQSRKK